MTSIKVKFRPSATDGKEGSIYYQVIRNRAVRQIGTELRLYESEWDKKTASVRIYAEISDSRKKYLQAVAERIRWDCKCLQAVIARLERKGGNYTVDDVAGEFNSHPDGLSLFHFMQGIIGQLKQLGRVRTSETYASALASFMSFRNGQDLLLCELDEDTALLYEAWLKGRGVKRNSSSCYLRTLRTLYRKAVDLGMTTDKDIFRHVFTGFAKTTKRAVPLDAIHAIRQLDLPEGSFLAFARDLFVLSVFLQGISFVDMAYLKKSDIKNGLLQYIRKKTGQSLSVGWEPAMQAIVDTYAHLTVGSPYLLPIITRQDGTERRQYERMGHKVNCYLKKIGKMVGLQIPLTTYVARHSWASVMRDLGVSLSIVSKGLGHESLKTTQIYLSSIDTDGVVKANRRMILKILCK